MLETFLTSCFLEIDNILTISDSTTDSFMCLECQGELKRLPMMLSVKKSLWSASLHEGLMGGFNCRLKFSYFVGSQLKFSISFVGCGLISVNK